MIVHDPVSFFSCQILNPDECLTDIEITEQIIIDSIQCDWKGRMKDNDC